jgi:hypothetical protein
MERSEIATAALSRSDRYLREVVEAIPLCPFARRCRAEGKLHRRVLLPEDDAAAALRELEAAPAAEVEVALFLFPLAERGSLEAARAFESFTACLRERTAVFYCVAFHPDLPKDLRDAARAVPFFRRSPDPTVQLVRRSILDAVRGTADDRYLDPATVEKLAAADLAQLPAPQASLSARIGEANLAAALREAPVGLEPAPPRPTIDNAEAASAPSRAAPHRCPGVP